MMAMDVKGITWVGNIYQKFENMCLEVEDTMFEETVKYIENQMQTVGESVKKLYSDVMQDLLSPSSCDDEMAAGEFPMYQNTDAGLCKKSFQGSMKVIENPDTELTSEDSRINNDVNNAVTHAELGDTDAHFISVSGNSVKGDNFTSHARRYIVSTDIKPNLDRDENLQIRKMPAFKAVTEISSSETDTCSTSESFELFHENKNHIHADTVSKPASAEVTILASAAECCSEIENASIEEITDVLALVKSAEEKEINTSSSSSFLFGDQFGFSVVRTTQPDECSSNTIIVSHDPETLRQYDELKLEETCIMVTRDEFQLLPQSGCHLKTSKCSKSKRRQPFSLSKKSARKQEYEELAIWHGNNKKGNNDCAENLCVEDQKKLLVADISEPEWELL